MDDETPKPNRREVVTSALERNYRGFVTTNKDDLQIAGEIWEEMGIRVIPITVDEETVAKETMHNIASQAMDTETPDMDNFYDALEQEGLGDKFALLIDIQPGIENVSEVSQIANGVRGMMQQDGVRYMVASDNSNEVPTELKVSAMHVY